MPDRKSLVSALWLTASLALLASVLVAPIRPSGFVTVSSRPDYPLRNLAPPPGQPTACLGAAMATEDVPRVSALPFESEEQDRAEAPAGPRVSFLIPGSFHKVSDRRLIALRSTLSHYPLRC